MVTYTGLIIGFLIIFLTPILGLWHKIFPKIGRKSWEAFIPFYNYYAALRACQQPWYWVFFLLFPGAQFIMFASINVTLIRKFGEFGAKETILGVLFPFPVFWQLANNDSKKPVEPTNWNIAKQVDARTISDHIALFFALPIVGNILVYAFSLFGFNQKRNGKKSMIKEWGDAILFALVAASVIRTYVFEPYQIPTGSMEKTMLIGDHLFVEKVTYGSRVPNTPFSYPIFHNMVPRLNVKSYSEIQKIPYTRLPGTRFVEQYDVTVFNFPAGDSALNDPRMPNGLIAHTYEQILRDEAMVIALQVDRKSIDYFKANYDYYLDRARKRFLKENEVLSRGFEGNQNKPTPIDGILTRPVDKRENYIKRTTAVAGQTIEIKDKELYVDGKIAWQAPEMQYNFVLKGYAYDSVMNIAQRSRPAYEAMEASFMKKFDCRVSELGRTANGDIILPLIPSKYTQLKFDYPNLQDDIKPKGYYLRNHSRGYLPIFPNDKQYDWTEDNFGPLKIPAKGDVVQLTHETLPIYRRIITAYEHHTLSETEDGIYIDGEKVTEYTIGMDYFWLMGDNRNNSADSRFWGFVPEDHIVGRAAFIWMSTSEKGYFGGIRWKRIFQKIE